MHTKQREADHKEEGCTLALVFAVQLVQLQEDYED